MTLRIERAAGIGFCFGVRRAIDILEKVAREHGGVETLGAVVHNRHVLQKLAGIGVRVADDVDDIRGNIVVISTHGVSPQVKEEIRARQIDIIDTTCPFVNRAQIAARRLADSGFFVIVFGDADHTEVKGILGCAKGLGIATMNEKFITALDHLPRRLGVLSQTTQVPASFTEFVKKLIDMALTRGSEMRVIDTICYDIRERQAVALELAGRMNLMLVIGGHNSANTKHLAELCSAVTETYIVETADEIQSSWFRGKTCLGVTAGASTDDQTISDVLVKLETMVKNQGSII